MAAGRGKVLGMGKHGRQLLRRPAFVCIIFSCIFCSLYIFFNDFFLSDRFGEVLKAPPALRGVLQLTCRSGKGERGRCRRRRKRVGACGFAASWLRVWGLTKRQHNCAGAAQTDWQLATCLGSTPGPNK